MVQIALIGFGEAGRTFAAAGCWTPSVKVFDIKFVEADGAAMRACTDTGVAACRSTGEALNNATVILSLVTADQALVAARQCAATIAQGALYFDMNSVAPATKQAAARVIESAGAQYLDAAIMAPVDPARLDVPVLISGPDAKNAAQQLQAIGFRNLRAVGDEVGRASTIKMIRSVMVKGIEALTAEMVLAANTAGVVDEVLRSLGSDWLARADYNLDRMLLHGTRRAAEMDEVVKTLAALGIDPAMTIATAARQRSVGGLGIAPPDGLAAKIDAIADRRDSHARKDAA